MRNPFRTLFRRTPGRTAVAQVVSRTSLEYLELIRQDAGASAVFASFAQSEFSLENWEAYVFLKANTSEQGSFVDWWSRHQFFKEFFMPVTREELNVPTAGRPTLRAAARLVNVPDTEHLDLIPAEARFLTDDVILKIRSTLLFNLADTWSRFVETNNGRQLLARLDQLP